LATPFGEDRVRSTDATFVPPGWDYNPASWSQRLPIVALALVGFGIAMYLSLYQWRLVDHVFEPFFGSGSRHILRESSVSRLTERYVGVPDAFLGAIGYLADAIAGVIGGRARWRRLPWVVIAFGIFVGPLGVVSIFLVVSQPLLFHAWCTLCLASAVVSVCMIGPAMDEFLASLQHLKRVKHAGESVWRAFWGFSTDARVDGRVATT
jgi:uncharacterized membrane protein